MTLFRDVLVVVGLTVLAGSPLLAQTTGRILGHVLDGSGANVPGAVVTATSTSMLGEQATTTNSQGDFRFLAVPPGVYTVRTESSGFKTVEQSDVVVGLERTVSLTVHLEIAAVSETVSVMGE